MSTEHVLKCAIAPICWCFIVPIWMMWFVLFAVFAPRSLPKVWWEFTDLLHKTIEAP